MARRLFLLAFLAAACVHAVTVSYGVAVPGTLATTTAGSPTITVTSTAPFEAEHMIISIAGVSGFMRILQISGNTMTLDIEADASVSNAPIRIIGDGLDHTSVRLWMTTDVDTCTAFWFDVVPHAAGPQYRYRSGEALYGKVTAATITGLAPNTYYYLRGNAKTNYGTDNSGACNTDACGATEFVLQTLPDTHDSSGRPPMPREPEPVAPQVTAQPDTTGYGVIPVPGFPDGVVTGTIASGSTQLTVNTIPSGMATGQWIVIAGAECPGHNWLAFYNPRPPWCRIASINTQAKTVTLEQPVNATVTNGAVSWGLYTVADLLNPANPSHVGYGTIFEWAQGYKAKWWATVTTDGGLGMKMRGMPVDSAASSMDDPAHRWIIFRTKSTPGTLPLEGIRTGPEFASVMGGIVAQNTSSGIIDFAYNDAYPVHHIRFENLEFTVVSADPTEADPASTRHLVGFDGGGTNLLPEYIVFDRMYLHTPDPVTRLGLLVAGWSGYQMSVVNSYLYGDYWRPAQYSFGDATITNSGTTLNSGGTAAPCYNNGPCVYQRNLSTPVWTAAPATITSSGTANKAVVIHGYVDPSGLNVRYTSGAGVTLTCNTCASIQAVATPSVPLTYKRIWTATMESGSAAMTWNGGTSRVNDSELNTEGCIGIYPDQGAHWLFENNYFEVYGTGQWYIDIPGRLAPPPRHITIRRNRFYWNQDHRLSSPTTNGYFYQVRHNAFESKRSQILLFEGNDVQGGWARINHGMAVSFSPTAARDTRPIVSGNSDSTVRYNLIHQQSEIMNFGGHEMHSPIMGRDARRMYFGNNLIYDQNAFVQNHIPSPAFFGSQTKFGNGGHDFIVEHNTWYNSLGNMPVLVQTTMAWAEGLWFRNNIWHLNKDGFYGMIVSPVDDGSLPQYPNLVTTGTFDVQLNSAAVRAAASVVPNYDFSSNVIICGVVAHNADPQTYVEITQSECGTYKNQFGALASKNYFPAGETRAERESWLGWVNTKEKDFQLRKDSAYASAGQLASDKTDVGVDVPELMRRLGTISDLDVVQIQSDQVTVHARVPDEGAACYVAYGSDTNPASWKISLPDTLLDRNRAMTISGLSGNTVYNYQVWCTGVARTAQYQFKTRQ